MRCAHVDLNCCWKIAGVAAQLQVSNELPPAEDKTFCTAAHISGVLLRYLRLLSILAELEHMLAALKKLQSETHE
jgi:hypothetical protein